MASVATSIASNAAAGVQYARVVSSCCCRCLVTLNSVQYFLTEDLFCVHSSREEREREKGMKMRKHVAIHLKRVSCRESAVRFVYRDLLTAALSHTHTHTQVTHKHTKANSCRGWRVLSDQKCTVQSADVIREESEGFAF